ncbi:hypothetical protein NP233_g2059 [Leucocoprinus birnbaumii]|uniref:DNA mismatch repair proteins mutS family domain-containing protein n=1 Tax=Leucocoprinus birnbaumii TaxID=56174 RepID=A0AAD5VZ13_9AGAR|nr:hypothetical protein NP233_g2059 [Leucocoprinus birnbaumii]
MAIFCSHGRVGAAYFDPSNFVLYLLEDTQESLHYDLTIMLLEQASPDIVLTSSKSDDDFIDTARNHLETTSATFQIRPYKEFSATKGKNRLFSLNRLAELPLDHMSLEDSSSVTASASLSRNPYDFMRKRRDETGDPTMKRWNASIRLSNFASTENAPLCISSAGALIDHLVREQAMGDFDDEGIQGLEIRDIEILTLNEIMHINADALISLQVFENENHASVHSEKFKEGLSLYGERRLAQQPSVNDHMQPLGTLNYTKTALGRTLLYSWLLRPSLSLPVIRSRHEAVACFLKPENLIPASAMHNHLKGIKNLSFHIVMLCDTLTELHGATEIDVLKRLLAAVDIPAVKEVGIQVNDVIDWEESNLAERICVRPGIDEELDNKKHLYHGIDSILSNVAHRISGHVPANLAATLNVIYFPQLGFLVCIPSLEWEAGVIPVPDDWTLQFSSDAHVYFKSPEMQDMDAHIGDIHSAIVDIELEIVQKLLEEVQVHGKMIGTVCDICAELDCLLSFAEATKNHDYREPDMVDDNIIEIIAGRHPLQEQVVDVFVPNDTRLAGGVGIDSSCQGEDGIELSSILLCTGANACGKVMRAQFPGVALIQIMAQIGCFVPAEHARLGLVDKSMFIGQIYVGSDCPIVLAATHFHEVFTEQLLNPRCAPITFCHMQVIFCVNEENDSEDDTGGSVISSQLNGIKTGSGEKITYLYKVAEGMSLDSHAGKCAALCGLPHRIVQRAGYVSNLISQHEINKLLDEVMNEKEKEELKAAEEICRRFLAWQLDERDGKSVKDKLAEILGKEDNN